MKNQRPKSQRPMEKRVNTINLTSRMKGEIPAREIQIPETPARPTTAYHELPGLNTETRDVLKQLDSNLAMLEDLGGRLGYLLSEVRGLIRR